MFMTLAIALTCLFLLQAPTPGDVGKEVSVLAVTLLGVVGSAIEQLVKKAVAPFDNASPMVKAMVTLAWGFGIAWVAGKVPWLAAQLPATPGGLSVASNGIFLTLVMMGLHKIKQVALPPEVAP